MRGEARALLGQGYDCDALIDKFGAFTRDLRADHREDDYDTVFGVLDFLTGWCSSAIKL